MYNVLVMYDLGEMKEKKGRKEGKTVVFFLSEKHTFEAVLLVVYPSVTLLFSISASYISKWTNIL